MNPVKPALRIPVGLLRKYDRPGPRYTSYPTAPTWSNKTAEEYQGALETASKEVETPLALYCHIPFCRKRCYYCGCNTVVTNNQDRAKRYIDYLKKEMAQVASALGERKRVSQLHFGGGTPTYLEAAGLESIVDAIRGHFLLNPNIEISVEVDPRVTTYKQLESLAQIGFKRVSVGCQDFDPHVQAACGRIQSLEQVSSLLEQCRRLQFKGINVDLIYGLPQQTVDRFDETLNKTIELRPDRIAVYSFAYLPQSLSNQALIKAEDLPTTETKYRLFSRAVEKFTEAGYIQIGMDHFALPHDELALAQTDGRLYRNFMGYSVQAAPDMIGFGMSAIGYVNKSFYQNQSKLDSYEQAVDASGLATYRGMILSDDDLIRQSVITSLMCNFRLSFTQLREDHGIDYHAYFAAEHDELETFVADKLLTVAEDGLEISPLGRTFVRNIAMTFDAYLRNGNKSATYSRTI